MSAPSIVAPDTPALSTALPPDTITALLGSFLPTLMQLAGNPQAEWAGLNWEATPQGGGAGPNPQAPTQGGWAGPHPQASPQGGWPVLDPQAPPEGWCAEVNPQAPPQGAWVGANVADMVLGVGRPNVPAGMPASVLVEALRISSRTEQVRQLRIHVQLAQ